MEANAPLRILIVDDHPIVRIGLAALIALQPDMCVAGEAEGGQKAVELFCRLRPDVVLMDLKMPGMDGVQAIAQIRRKCPSARILVLTTYDGDEDIYHGLQAGAQGYLLKDVHREELIQAIHTVAAGGKYIPSEIAARLAGFVFDQDLTEREMEVLHHLVAGKSNQEIGAALQITEGTVKSHVVRILHKLNVSDRTQAVIAALKRGFVRLE